MMVELVPSGKQSAPNRARLQYIRPLSLTALESKPLGVTLHLCSKSAAMRVMQRDLLHGRPIVREHECVHKPACSQLVGMTAHHMGCATPDIVRMIALGAGWAVAAVQETALPRSPFSAGKTWAKERQGPFWEKHKCSRQ